MATPEVRARLGAKQGFIFNKLLFKQHAGFKRVQAQHALAKAVNGKDGSFIHLPLGQQQPVRRLFPVRDLV